MSIDKMPIVSSLEAADPRHEALRNREAFIVEIDAVASTDELVAVLDTYSYSDRRGERVLPVYIQEAEDYASTVPHDGLWVVAAAIPLNKILTALADYEQGHLSEQQLYYALMHYSVSRAMQRITGVNLDDAIQMKLFRGELPDRGGEGETIEGISTQAPKAIGKF